MSVITRSAPPVAASSGPMSNLRWALTDGWTIALRAIQHWMRQPAAIVIGLLSPIMMVLLNAYVYSGSIVLPDGGNYKAFLMPGMFALTMMFGLTETAIAIHTDSAKGVTDRFRSMPMAPAAVVLGRSIADMLNSLVTLLLMTACGLLVGWGWHEGPVKALAAMGLLLLLRFAFIWMGVYLGLAFKTPQAVSSVQILIWPFGMLSSAFVSPENMPTWLGKFADWNPLSSTATAVRDLCGNPGVVGRSWIDTHAMLMAVGWPVALIAVFFPLSVRAYRRLGR